MNVSVEHTAIKEGLSRSTAAGLIMLTLAVWAVFPDSVHSSTGFFTGGILILLAGVFLLRSSASEGFPLGWQWVVFLALSLIAVFYSPYWMRSWTKFTWLLLGFLMYFVSWRTVRDLSLLNRLLGFIAVVAVFSALFALWQQWQEDPIARAQAILSTGAYSTEMREDMLYALSTGRIRGAFGNPNHLAGFLVACSSPLLLLLLRGRGLSQRALGLLGFLPIAWVIWQTQSRSGFLTLILAVLILAIGSFSDVRKNIFHWKLSPLKIGVILLILIVLAFAFAESWVVLSRVATVRTRAEYYSVALKLIGKAPVLGYGLDTFALYYPQYHQLGRGEAQYVHNWLLQVWVEMGIIGLAAFLWFLYSIFRLFNERLNAAQNAREESALLALMSSVSAIVLQSLFDFNTDVPAIFIYFGFFLGCLSGMATSRIEQTDLRQGIWNRVSLRWTAAAFLLLFLILGIALPFYAERNHFLGLALVRAGQPPLEATPFLKLATVYNPWHAGYQNSLGNHYLATGQPRQATAHLKRAVALNPLFPRYRFELYRALNEIGQSQEALEQMELAHQLHPTDDTYLAELAHLYQAHGDTDKALQYWNQAIHILESAIEANPGKAEYHRRLALILDTVGKQQQAASHRQEADEIMNSILQRLGLSP